MYVNDSVGLPPKGPKERVGVMDFQAQSTVSSMQRFKNNVPNKTSQT
jgi:hypothetical protein